MAEQTTNPYMKGYSLERLAELHASHMLALNAAKQAADQSREAIEANFPEGGNLWKSVNAVVVVKREKPGNSWVYNHTKFAPLKKLLTKKEWESLTTTTTPEPVTKVNNVILNGMANQRGEPIAGHVRNARVNANEGAPDRIRVAIDWDKAVEVAEAAEAAKAEKTAKRRAIAKAEAAGLKPKKAGAR